MSPHTQETVPADSAAVPAAFYQMSIDDKQVVLGAQSSLDVPAKVRNKLYAAIGRALGKPSVNQHMVAEWKKATDSGAGGGHEQNLPV